MTQKYKPRTFLSSVDRRVVNEGLLFFAHSSTSGMRSVVRCVSIFLSLNFFRMHVNVVLHVVRGCVVCSHLFFGRTFPFWIP